MTDTGGYGYNVGIMGEGIKSPRKSTESEMRGDKMAQYHYVRPYLRNGKLVRGHYRLALRRR